MKYEYKFVRIELSMGIIRDDKPAKDYRRVIEQHANDGWRLVQIFAPGTGESGSASYFELIFEKPTN